MKTQISRLSHDPTKRYSGVYQQQGRMITDADWNELVAIVTARLDEALRDVVGSGMPSDAARQLRVEPGLDIVPGVLYAGGVPASLPDRGGAPWTYADQPDFPSPPGSPQANEVLYADVWDRPVLFLEDADLRDPGLHGADTCTRTQTMLQIKRLPMVEGGADAQENSPEGAARNPPMGNARATLSLRAGVPEQAVIAADARTGNGLFRLEVHAVEGPANAPAGITLKWSSENGAEVYPASGPPPAAFKGGEWIYEYLDPDWDKLAGVHHVSHAAPGDGPASELKAGYDAAFEGGPRLVRRWDGACTIRREAGASWAEGALVEDQAWDRGEKLSARLDPGEYRYVGFADGVLEIDAFDVRISLELDGRSFVAGDHWVAPIRERQEAGFELLTQETPRGIRHRYVTLGTVEYGSPGVRPPPGGTAPPPPPAGTRPPGESPPPPAPPTGSRPGGTGGYTGGSEAGSTAGGIAGGTGGNTGGAGTGGTSTAPPGGVPGGGTGTGPGTGTNPPAGIPGGTAELVFVPRPFLSYPTLPALNEFVSTISGNVGDAGTTLAALRAEVTDARGSSATLDARLDASDLLIAGKSNVGHHHVRGDIDDFAHKHVKADVTDFAHTHPTSEVGGLDNRLEWLSTALQYPRLDWNNPSISKQATNTSNNLFVGQSAGIDLVQLGRTYVSRRLSDGSMGKLMLRFRARIQPSTTPAGSGYWWINYVDLYQHADNWVFLWWDDKLGSIDWTKELDWSSGGVYAFKAGMYCFTGGLSAGLFPDSLPTLTLWVE